MRRHLGAVRYENLEERCERRKDNTWVYNDNGVEKECTKNHSWYQWLPYIFFLQVKWYLEIVQYVWSLGCQAKGQNSEGHLNEIFCVLLRRVPSTSRISSGKSLSAEQCPPSPTASGIIFISKFKRDPHSTLCTWMHNSNLFQEGHWIFFQRVPVQREPRERRQEPGGVHQRGQGGALQIRARIHRIARQ